MCGLGVAELWYHFLLPLSPYYSLRVRHDHPTTKVVGAVVQLPSQNHQTTTVQYPAYRTIIIMGKCMKSTLHVFSEYIYILSDIFHDLCYGLHLLNRHCLTSFIQPLSETLKVASAGASPSRKEFKEAIVLPGMMKWGLSTRPSALAVTMTVTVFLSPLVFPWTVRIPILWEAKNICVQAKILKSTSWMCRWE